MIRSVGLAMVGLFLSVATAAAAPDPLERNAMRKIIVEEALNSPLPPSLALALAKVESDFDSRAVSGAGALVTVDCILSSSGDAKIALRDFVCRLSGNAIDFDREVAESEKEWGHRNRAMANFLKSQNNLENDVEVVLDAYFHQCALAMSCRELSRTMLYLANEGVSPVSKESVVTMNQARRINSIMLTCGLYDAVGNFAYHVGLPGKSGVGGGIVVVVPKRLALCVWSPGLDAAGNSLAGIQALEMFAAKSGHSIF